MATQKGSRWRTALLDPAYAAAIALIVIQVGIGVIYKLAAQGGKTKASYQFSTSAAVTISESLKFFISLAFFYRECRQRRSATPEYTLADADTPSRNSLDSGDDENGADYDLEAAKETSHLNGHGEDVARDRSPSSTRSFLGMIKAEIPSEAKYGYIKLALLYAFLNNTIYVSYKLADPGTILLLKSGVTVVTAMVMYCSLGTTLNKLQWVAIVLQLCGLVTTQYNPESGSTYALSTYLLLITQTVISACAGVYNQNLNKSQNASLHVDNMILYSAGAGVNLIIHVITKLFRTEEPGFFVGYDDPKAIMVVLSNVFIGLAITAVYKYANAIIKCLATAVATGILLYLSPVLFNTTLSFLVLPGTFVVFTSTWLYMEATPAKNPAGPQNSEKSTTSGPRFIRSFSSLLSLCALGNKLATSLWTVFTILFITSLCISSSHLKDLREDGTGASDQSSPYSSTIVQSPFSKTLGYIRINKGNLFFRREQLVEYEPYFHTTHYSVPNDDHHRKDWKAFSNMTDDNYGEHETTYHNVAKVMKDVLSAPPESNASEIEGLFFFHFDVWVDPLQFANENFKNIWGAALHETRPSCMTDPDEFGDPYFTNERKWERVQKANRRIKTLNLGFKVDEKEFCYYWADIYYVPRRFFADWILLAEAFYEEKAFHELAVPTMHRIIEQTRQSSEFVPAISHIGDCFGGCCSGFAPQTAVAEKRCGHQLNFQDQDISDFHFDRLRSGADMLGTEVTRYRPGTTAFWELRGNTTTEANTAAEHDSPVHGSGTIKAVSGTGVLAKLQKFLKDMRSDSNIDDEDGKIADGNGFAPQDEVA